MTKIDISTLVRRLPKIEIRDDVYDADFVAGFLRNISPVVDVPPPDSLRNLEELPTRYVIFILPELGESEPVWVVDRLTGEVIRWVSRGVRRFNEICEKGMPGYFLCPEALAVVAARWAGANVKGETILRRRAREEQRERRH